MLSYNIIHKYISTGMIKVLRGNMYCDFFHSIPTTLYTEYYPNLPTKSDNMIQLGAGEFSEMTLLKLG